MTHRRRRFRRLILTVAVVTSLATVAACTDGAGTPSPVPSPSASAPAVVSPSVPTASPSPSPVPATPSAAPTAAPSPTPVPTPCPVKATRIAPPTDRLVDVSASTAGDQDQVVFHFGNMSVPGPGGPPTGRLSLAKKPYTEGASGRPIDMQGERVAQVVFQGLSLVADTGDPVYTGPRELQPDLTALKHAVEFDESEGVIGWYLGFDGPGCVTISRDGKDIIVTFAHAG